jgi:hypothetical protein
MAENQENGQRKNRVIQIMPAEGWRVFEFTQDQAGKTEILEVAVVGWGLRDTGQVSLLISLPNGSSGYNAMSINDYPVLSVERYRNKTLHYQAVAPFQKLEDVKEEAEFILKFMRTNGNPPPTKSPESVAAKHA